jgi:hypothetical protein
VPRLFALLGIVLGIACSRERPPVFSVRDSVLRTELLARVALDQAVRDMVALELRATGMVTPELFGRLSAIDSTNLAWLKPRILAEGLPTRLQVGEDGMEAVFLLVQHADRDPGFQAQVLPLAEAAFQAGDLEGEEFAMLSDRVARAQGRPQRYGTQADITDGQVVIDHIEDSAGVDGRRAALGLLPLAAYKRVLDSVYGRREVP